MLPYSFRTHETHFKMAIIGYARVSTIEQNLDIQIHALQLKNCEKIFSEKLSGLDSNRPELEKCLNYLRTGDTLVITKLDRLARSVLHLAEINRDFDLNGIDLIVIDQHIDTSTTTGKLLFNMLACIAEFENSIRRERCADGIRRAKQLGRYDKPSKLSSSQLTEMFAMRENGATVKECIQQYDISKATFYRLKSVQ